MKKENAIKLFVEITTFYSNLTISVLNFYLYFLFSTINIYEGTTNNIPVSNLDTKAYNTHLWIFAT